MRMLLVGQHQIAGGGGGSSTYWFDYFNKTPTQQAGNINASNNSVVMFTNDAFTGFILATIDANGNIAHKTEVTTAGTLGMYSATLDSSGNVFYTEEVKGFHILTSSLGHNSSKSWSTLTKIYAIRVDGSGNVYISYQGIAAGVQSVGVMKLDSSLNVTWDKSFRDASNITAPIEDLLEVDSSGNVFVAVSRTSSQAILSISSTGTLNWARTLSSRSVRPNSLAVDGSGNAYIIYSNLSNNYQNIFKINSSGTTVWKKRLPNNSFYGGIGVSSGGNVYVSTQDTNSSIYKLDSSGNLVNGIHLVYNSGQVYAVAVKITSDEKIFIIGSNGLQMIATLLPNDGSLAGTYGSLVYVSGDSTTVTNSTDSLTTYSPTVATATNTTQTMPTTTFSSSSLTSTQTTIP